MRRIGVFGGCVRDIVSNKINWYCKTVTMKELLVLPSVSRVLDKRFTEDTRSVTRPLSGDRITVAFLE